MKKRLLVFLVILLSGSFFSAFYFIQKTQAQGSNQTTMALQTDIITQTQGIEDNQTFPVYIKVSPPEDSNYAISGLDATLTYDNNKFEAIKVLAGQKPEFANGYFGVTQKVDNDPTCKSNAADQSERLRCAIDQDNGLVSITALNLAGSDFQTVDENSYPNPPVTGPEFTLATVIFKPKVQTGTIGSLALDYSENKSNAYSWVDLSSGPDTQNVLGGTAPVIDPTITINNNTKCNTDFNRDKKIWGDDLAQLFADYRENCIIEYCRSDLNNDGKIWGDDLAQLFAEYSQGQSYCQP